MQLSRDKINKNNWTHNILNIYNSHKAMLTAMFVSEINQYSLIQEQYRLQKKDNQKLIA